MAAKYIDSLTLYNLMCDLLSHYFQLRILYRKIVSRTTLVSPMWHNKQMTI